MGTVKKSKIGGVAAKRAKKRAPAQVEPLSTSLEVVTKSTSRRNQVTVLQVQVVQLLAHGYTIPEVAKKLGDRLVPHESDRKKRLKKARTRIRAWMASQKMRDLLWEYSVHGLDLKSPQILNGVARKAVAGRVDAAKLALEITGRHAPQAEVSPATINIQFGDIPRPPGSTTDRHDGGEVVDGDAEIDDAEWSED